MNTSRGGWPFLAAVLVSIFTVGVGIFNAVSPQRDGLRPVITSAGIVTSVWGSAAQAGVRVGDRYIPRGTAQHERFDSPWTVASTCSELSSPFGVWRTWRPRIGRGCAGRFDGSHRSISSDTPSASPFSSAVHHARRCRQARPHLLCAVHARAAVLSTVARRLSG